MDRVGVHFCKFHYFSNAPPRGSRLTIRRPYLGNSLQYFYRYLFWEVPFISGRLKEKQWWNFHVCTPILSKILTTGSTLPAILDRHQLEITSLFNYYLAAYIDNQVLLNKSWYLRRLLSYPSLSLIRNKF